MLRSADLRKEVRYIAARSGGPGGQNVNKTASAVTLYWDLENSQALSEVDKERVRSKMANAINKEGLVYLRCDEFRDQERNKDACFIKLKNRIARALERPKKRVATKPTKASLVRNRKVREKRSEIKKLRKRLRW